MCYDVTTLHGIPDEDKERAGHAELLTTLLNELSIIFHSHSHFQIINCLYP